MSQVAVIDCGTNSIRLLIANVSSNSFEEVVRTMEIVRLGQGVDENKAFHPDAINRTLLAVKSFKEIIEKNKVEKIRFCATSATSPDAMSTGDEQGRGTGNFLDIYNDNAGTKTDIAERKDDIKINRYNQYKPYYVPA